MTQTRSLMESALLTGLSVVMFIGSNLPVAGLLIALMSPVPLVVLGLRHPMKNSLMGLAVGSIIVMITLGPVSALSFLLGFALLGVLLGRLVQTRKTAVEIMLYGSMISLTCKLLLMAVMVIFTGINPLNMDMAEMQSMMDGFLNFKFVAELDPQALSVMKEQWRNTIALMPMIVPTILVMASAVDCWLSYRISAAVIKRLRGQPLPALPPFRDWRFPSSVLWAFFAAVLCTYAGFEVTAYKDLLLKVGLNLRLLTSTLFIIEGMAVGTWFMKRKNMSNLFIGLMIGAVMFMPLLTQIATMAGIIDISFDLRARYGGDN